MSEPRRFWRFDKDVQAARSAARGILAAASQPARRQRGGPDRARRKGRRGRGGPCRRGRRRLAVPEGSDRRRARRAPAGHCGAARIGRRRRRHRRRRRCLLRAWPRLRIDRHDLRDASDQGRLPGASRPDQRLASALAAPAVQRAIAARVVDHGRPERRRRPQQRGADRARRLAHHAANGRRPSSPTAKRPMASSPPRGARADAASTDQVLVAFLKQDYTLEPLVGWDAFGMRGTCSEGFKLVASGSSEQILPVSYDKIHAQTMMPVAHLALERRMGRHRHRRGRSRPRLRAQGRATRRRHAAAGRRSSDARQCFAAHAAQPHRHGAAAASKRPRPIRRRSNPSTSRPA